MPGARYAMLQGVGHISRPVKEDASNIPQNWPEMWRKWPHLLVQGPSGQLAILPPPSGAGSDFFDTGTAGSEQGAASRYYNYLHVSCHKPFGWKWNSAVHFWRHALNSSATDPGWRWHPYKHEARFQNPSSGPIFDTNNNYHLWVINDGHNNTLHFFGEHNTETGCGGVPVQDGVVYGRPYGNGVFGHGNWTGNLPTEAQASPKYLWPGKRLFGNPGESDEHFVFPDQNTAGFGRGLQGNIQYGVNSTADPNDQGLSHCDIIEHEGTIYMAGQEKVWAHRIGQKGSFIHTNYWDNRQDETGGEGTFGLANVDTTRGTFASFGSAAMRVFAKHRGDLYMLDNTGKVFQVHPQQLQKIADLKTELLDSPFGSGITGGSIQRTPLVSAGQFTQPRAFRPLLVSFNDQLHAFLNYEMTTSTFEQRTGTPVGKPTRAGEVEGVCWFTSHDGINWSDRTTMLADVSQSGIITPSGNNVQVSTWTALTSPFIHSAFQTVPYPSGYGARTGVVDPNGPGGFEGSHLTGNKAPILRGSYEESFLEPSGYRQATGQPTETSSRHQNDVDSGEPHMGGDTDRLPIWTSGNMIDDPGTPFNQLQIKLDKGSVSGWLYPTVVNYPSGYDYIEPSQLDGITVPTNLLPKASGGVWGPFGQGTEGWDFTGVRGRHVTGYVDESDEETNNHELKLCFSDNPPGTASLSANQVASHFFALNKASGWRQVNYVHWGGAMCGGYTAVDIHDPEVVIPSGAEFEPNPFVDPINERVRVRFKVLDFGYWDTVKMKFQYTIDEGQNWHDATVSGNLNVTTGTKQADPSGLGDGRDFDELFWLYPEDLGSNEFFPQVRIRMRAEVK